MVDAVADALLKHLIKRCAALRLIGLMDNNDRFMMTQRGIQLPQA